MLDVEPQPVEQTHINIGYKHQGKLAQHVSAPVGIQQLKARKDQHQRRDVVAEAVLTGKQVEELALWQRPARAPVFAELARLAKDLFVRNGPAHAGDRNSQK